VSTPKKPSKRSTTRRRTPTTTAKPTPAPATPKARFPCETCGKPHTCASDNVAYCDDCAPPVRLGEELFHALFSPKLRGLRPGHWSVCLTSVWGESETGVLDLYEKRVGRDLSVDEARACIDTARSVAESLHRVCDVASAVLDHGAETVRKVCSPASPRAIVQTVSVAPRRDAAELLRHVADIATDLDSHELSFLVTATVSGRNPSAFYNGMVSALGKELSGESYQLDDDLAYSENAGKRCDYWRRVKETRELVGLMAELLDAHIDAHRKEHAEDMGTLA
jgi:hypothetical protein